MLHHIPHVLVTAQVAIILWAAVLLGLVAFHLQLGEVEVLADRVVLQHAPLEHSVLGLTQRDIQLFLQLQLGIRSLAGLDDFLKETLHTINCAFMRVVVQSVTDAFDDPVHARLG